MCIIFSWYGRDTRSVCSSCEAGGRRKTLILILGVSEIDWNIVGPNRWNRGCLLANRDSDEETVLNCDDIGDRLKER